MAAMLEERPELLEHLMRITDLCDPKAGGKGLNVEVLEGFLRPELRALEEAALKGLRERAEEEKRQETKMRKKED